ncbi:MAG TPA: uracil-DNA glycosylase [Bacteroidia bacterium]|nr:uracil-DNA glycosylase [Bacteroidia bacterium]
MEQLSSTVRIDPIMEAGWKKVLKEEFNSDYFAGLRQFLLTEKAAGKVIYPPGHRIFSAFDLTPFDKVQVVILGQDPYHGAGQANGLCFSVADGIPKPPSLVNIFKELHNDLGMPVPSSGNLESWAKQGVLLLNATLTVRAAEAGSHQNKGWEQFTNAVISKLSKDRDGLVFVLWGRYAQAKEPLIDKSKHVVLKAAHPSPLSAYNGFFGCKHFSKINELLISKGKKPVDWKL